MSANLAHFSLNADDVAGSRRFYESVFGWSFTAWGPPGFYAIDTGADGIAGALQQRRKLGGRTVNGVEATFAVDDVDEIARRVRASGGDVVLDRHTIAGVGHLIFLADPAGNVVGAMHYDAKADT
ncbi:VOC family protein [Gordonia sp. NPDC003950]